MRGDLWRSFHLDDNYYFTMQLERGRPFSSFVTAIFSQFFGEQTNRTARNRYKLQLIFCKSVENSIF